MTTLLTSYRSNTRAVSARCGHRSNETATSLLQHQAHDRRPSKPRNRPPNHRPNRRPLRNPNRASDVGRSVVCKASVNCSNRRKSRARRLLVRGSWVMEKACEVRRYQGQLPLPLRHNRRPSKRQNSTSNPHSNRSRRRSKAVVVLQLG